MVPRGCRRVESIVRRMSRRASRAWSSVPRMIASSMPSIFRSSWMPVMPWPVPAILKSMSPKWSSSPMMSVSSTKRSGSLTRPIEMPATGSLIGTPASISASVPPHTDAIDAAPVDPLALQDQVADDPLLQGGQGGPDLPGGVLRLDALRRQLGLDLVLELLDAGGPLGLAARLLAAAELVAVPVQQEPEQGVG